LQGKAVSHTPKSLAGEISARLERFGPLETVRAMWIIVQVGAGTRKDQKENIS